MKLDLDIRVAQLQLEEDQIIINKGSKDNIKSYMRFLVYEKGEEVTDPISGKSLGLLERPKGTFKVLHIQENMSTLISELKRDNNFPINLTPIFDLEPERKLMKSIRNGDMVKVINYDLIEQMSSK